MALNHNGTKGKKQKLNFRWILPLFIKPRKTTGEIVAQEKPVWLPGFALVFATVVGLLSGLYPALRAATLVPVNALKYE